MQGITAGNVRQEFKRLLPLSIVDEVTCFVFYDNHPRDEKCIDITVCTKTGELREYFQRDLLSSITLNAASEPTEIIIMRNGKSELFYIVGNIDEVFIVSAKATLLIHTKITNVDKFSIDDPLCTGQASLRVIRKDDAVPIIFDENFKSSEVLFPVEASSDLLPLVTELKRKCIEAQYSVKNYEKTIEGCVRLRHEATLLAYQNVHLNHGDSVIKAGSNIYGALKVKTQKPWVKVCNEKIVIALKVVNEYKEPLEDVHILLNSANRVSLSYTTKLFERTNLHPFWKEKQNQRVLPNCEATVVGVMSMEEIKIDVTSRIFNVALSYKTSRNAYLMPFDDVVLSSLATLGDEFDALSSEYDANTIIAVLSTTEKTDLRVRHIRTDGETVSDLLIKHLHMERVGPDLIVYKKSPYHALNGTMLHFLDGGSARTFTVSAYTRTKSQLLSLIHIINDAVPAKIIITTTNYIITGKTPELSEYTEKIPKIPEKDYAECATTILNRTGKVIEYLDRSMVRMSESKDPEIVRKIGFQTDLYACGKGSYTQFRDTMLEEGKKGVESLMKEDIGSDVEPMAID